MSDQEDRIDTIIQLLNQLIDLVKTTHPTVENHTHHHYPTAPTYTYPTFPYYYGNVSTSSPGTTTTWSTNDENPTVT